VVQIWDGRTGPIYLLVDFDLCRGGLTNLEQLAGPLLLGAPPLLLRHPSFQATVLLQGHNARDQGRDGECEAAEGDGPEAEGGGPEREGRVGLAVLGGVGMLGCWDVGGWVALLQFVWFGLMGAEGLRVSWTDGWSLDLANEVAGHMNRAAPH
jgi:hypothetical protein